MGSPHRSTSSSPVPAGRSREEVTRSNSALVAGLITVLSLGGAAVFFIWLQQRTAAPEDAESPRVVVLPGEDDPATSGEAASLPEDRPADESMEPVTGPGTAEMVKMLARAVMTRDATSVRALLGERVDEADIAALISALESAAIAIDPSQPVTDLGSDGVAERWAVNLLDPSSGESLTLRVDFLQGRTGAWEISKVSLPDAVTADALTSSPVILQADKFLKTLAVSEYAGLKDFVLEESVPNEKLAALGILFEEAEFLPKEKEPLRVTSVSADRAWVIAKVHSKRYAVDSEFGLELKKVGDAWLIERINLSRLMREFTSMASGTDAYNPPLVSTPSGGDSIVLYFGYDDEQLTSRSMKQLAVVASILKGNELKELRISGHADAHGGEDYNEDLSLRRARRVAEALRSLGVRKSQVELEAHGKRQPLSPNVKPDGSDNPAGRERNRRAEIYLDF